MPNSGFGLRHSSFAIRHSAPESENAKPETRNFPARPALRLHIERVVLDGVALAAAEQPRFRAALAEELTRMLGAEPAGAFRGDARARRGGGVVHLAAESSAEAWARQVAQSLFSTLQSDSQFSAAFARAEAARGPAADGRCHPAEFNPTTKNHPTK